MIRTFVLLSSLIIGLVATATPGFSQPVAATPENAGSFVGDWALSLEGAQGPAQFMLTVKLDAGKVAGSVAMGEQGTQPVTDVTLNGKALVLKYMIDYQGNPVDVTITLTPNGDKFNAEAAFAGGAYTMSGTAEKKK